jgi:hypothetical protein
VSDVGDFSSAKSIEGPLFDNPCISMARAAGYSPVSCLFRERRRNDAESELVPPKIRVRS